MIIIKNPYEEQNRIECNCGIEFEWDIDDVDSEYIQMTSSRFGISSSSRKIYVVCPFCAKRHDITEITEDWDGF